MSGTSLDGIDVAIVDVPRLGKVRVVAHFTTPYPRAVRQAILDVSNCVCHTGQISRLNFLLPELYAKALRDLCVREGIPLDSIRLIGCHGQTIFHEDKPTEVARHRVASTLQIGDGSVLAELTGIAVVSDLRMRDMAAGGRGAPLVPFADLALFRHKSRGRVALNLGGIANLTSIPPNCTPDQAIAFDTGPGNMVMDQIISRATGGRLTYDRGGKFAQRGKVSRELLAQMMDDPFYSMKPPKTTGREQYGKDYVDRVMASGLPTEDLIATSCLATASIVAQAVGRFVRPRHAVDDLVVGGGGAANPVLMRHLGELLPGARVVTTEEFGVHPDAKEAVAFAMMAHATWHRKPSNVPSATGARRAVVLGKLSPA
jgi:anhydro-N-acetylmuramic acid kinase